MFLRVVAGVVVEALIELIIKNMAKTEKGKKIVEVRRHYRTLPDGRRVLVKEHRKSTPN